MQIIFCNKPATRKDDDDYFGRCAASYQQTHALKIENVYKIYPWLDAILNIHMDEEQFPLLHRMSGGDFGSYLHSHKWKEHTESN